MTEFIKAHPYLTVFLILPAVLGFLYFAFIVIANVVEGRDPLDGIVPA